jgi:hypothetical protein
MPANGHWPVSREAFKDESHWLLKMLARLPHDYNTTHTVPNGYAPN